MASLSSLLNPSTGADCTDQEFSKSHKHDAHHGGIQHITNNQDIKIENEHGMDESADNSKDGYSGNTGVKARSRPISVTELLVNQSHGDYDTSGTASNTSHRRSHQQRHRSGNNGGTSNTSSNGKSHSRTDADNSTQSTTHEQENSKSYQTLLINARSRHLKKNDGEPYWRNEIQFKFLMSLFFNYDRVFRNPYYNTFHGFDWPDHFKYYKDKDGELHLNNGEMLTFFELYLITLLKSSKISKILKARLMLDINYALNFAIICLLVNIGRLNTTVNFDYEMKSQFRTYHSIPSLQVGNHFNIIEKYYPIHQESQKIFYDEDQKKHIDPTSKTPVEDEKTSSQSKLSLNNPFPQASASIRNGSGYTMSTVKQLQDTPRIKSILKSVNDLSGKSLRTYADFIRSISTEYHNYNIVSVVFLICAYEYEIGQSFFPSDLNSKQDSSINSTGSLLNDIWLRPKFKSTDKVKKFLWLIYTIMETGLSVSRILSNPFNDTESSEGVKLDENLDLSEELSLMDEKCTVLSPTIMKLAAVIPIWTTPDANDKIDPFVNDFDTAQEVEFAAQMKHLRVQFVENETQNTTLTNIFQNTTVEDEKPGNNNNNNSGDDDNHNDNSNGNDNDNPRTSDNRHPERLMQTRSHRNKRTRSASNDLSLQFYHPDKDKNYSRQKIMESATNDDYAQKNGSSYLSSVLDIGFSTGNRHDDDDYYDDELDDNLNDLNGNGNGSSHFKNNEETDDEPIIDDSYDQSEYNDNINNLSNNESSNANNTYSSNNGNANGNINENSRKYQIVTLQNQKRPNDETLELSATDPMPMSSYEDNYDDGGLIGFFNYGYPGSVVNEYRKDEDGGVLLTSCVKKRKTRKQINIEPPIQTTVKNLTLLLNKDFKNINSNSKNALLKRERNRMISEFIFQLIKVKQTQAKQLRHSEGNWRHFTKHLWDLNMFVEKEQLNLRSTYADWGEFKTTMKKVLNQVNCVINERIKIDEKMDKKDEDVDVSFIDDVFAQL